MIRSAFCAIACFAVMAAAVVGGAEAASAAPVGVTIDGITYVADDADVSAGATITDYVPGPTDVVIPSSVDIAGETYAVTTIGIEALAFNGLTSVSIPNSVTTIMEGGLAGNSLTSITIPSSVTTIGPAAFAINQLTTVTIPETVTSLGALSFALNQLTTANLPNNLTTIPNGIFNRNVMTSITIPDSVTVIEPFAFYDNDLTSLTFPSGLTDIGEGAFLLNPVTSAVFSGRAPSIAFDVFNEPANSDAVVTYFWRFGDPRVVNGFTTPTWEGYVSAPVARVVFDSTGGNSAPSAQTMSLGSVVTEPAEPQRPGYTFTGWFVAPTGGNQWNFSEALTDANLSASSTADLTLYAQWTSNALAATGPRASEQLAVGAVVALLAGALLVGARWRRRVSPND